MIISISGKIGSGKDTVGDIIQYLDTKQNINTGDWKTTLENFPKELSKFKRKRFADKLKDIVCLLIGCTRGQLEDREFKEKELGEEWRIWYMTHYKLSNNNSEGRIGKIYSSEEELLSYEDSEFFKSFKLDGYQIVSKLLTPRLLLQLLGTECGRNIIHPNIWVNALMADYRGKSLGIDKYGVQTIKYPNWIITDVRFPNEVKAIKAKGGIVIRINRTYQYGKQTLDNINQIADQVFNTEHPSETALDDYDDFDYIIENDGSIEDLIEKVKRVLQAEYPYEQF